MSENTKNINQLTVTGSLKSFIQFLLVLLLSFTAKQGVVFNDWDGIPSSDMA